MAPVFRLGQRLHVVGGDTTKTTTVLKDAEGEVRFHPGGGVFEGPLLLFLEGAPERGGLVFESFKPDRPISRRVFLHEPANEEVHASSSMVSSVTFSLV